MEATIVKQQGRAEKIARTDDNLKKRGQAKITVGIVESTLKRLEKWWEEYEATHHSMEKNATQEELKLSYFEDDVFSQTEDAFLVQRGMLLDRMHAFTQGGQPQATNGRPTINQSLPNLKLPQFTGIYTEWRNFRDLFSSLVIDNASLSNIERMHYLKMSVQQEPASLIASVPTNADKFTDAWQMLVNRYENTRLLTSAQVAKLVDLTPVKSESSTELQRLYNSTIGAIGALRTLGRSIDTCDLTVYLTVQKLDRQSRREWEAYVGGRKDPPPFKELQTFIENRISALEALECTKHHPSHNSDKVREKTIRSHHITRVAPTPRKCVLCKQDHFILFCKNFRAKSATDRKTCVMKNNLCINCLGHHRVWECRSQKTCHVCKDKHHTMLHDTYTNTAPSARNTKNRTSSVASQDNRARLHTSSTALMSHNVQYSEGADSDKVLLATALVNVHSASESSLVRALLDQGSEASFITESLAQRLRLSQSSAPVIITGIGADSNVTSKGRVTLKLTPRANAKFEISIDAYVLPRVTTYRPPESLSSSQWPHLKGLSLADPTFTNSSPIELVLGANVYSRLLRDRVRQGPIHTPTAQNSHLGWILSGHVGPSSGNMSQRVALHSTVDRSSSSDRQRFWEQEEAPAGPAPLRSEDYEGRRSLEALDDSIYCHIKKSSTTLPQLIRKSIGSCDTAFILTQMINSVLAGGSTPCWRAAQTCASQS